MPVTAALDAEAVLKQQFMQLLAMDRDDPRFDNLFAQVHQGIDDMLTAQIEAGGDDVS